MTVEFNKGFQRRLEQHLEMFKNEAKRLRFQLNTYKREFLSRDTTFLKLRNACAAQEFTFSQLKRYLSEQNIRMVYKVLGLTLPKPLRDKFAKGGADFSDYFPTAANLKPTVTIYKSSLGLIEEREPPTAEELIQPSKKVKKKEEENQGQMNMELAAMLQ